MRRVCCITLALSLLVAAATSLQFDCESVGEVVGIINSNLITFNASMLSNCDSMTGLFLDFNDIVILNASVFTRFSKLQTLSIKNNRIVNFTGTLDLPELTDLDLSFNQLDGFNPHITAQLPKLNRLNLNGNPITTLEHEAGMLRIPSLQHLRLQTLKLTEIPPRAFANLPLLRELYLTNNKITSLKNGSFVGLSNLDVLCVSNNTLKWIYSGTLSDLTSLNTLYMNSNLLPELRSEYWLGLPLILPRPLLLHLTCSSVAPSSDLLVC